MRLRGNADSELSIKITKPNEELPEFVTGWSGQSARQVPQPTSTRTTSRRSSSPPLIQKLEYAEFRAFERAANNYIRFDLPELTEKTNGGYRGGDLFWFDNLTICRAIRIYRTQDLDGKAYRWRAKDLLQSGQHPITFLPPVCRRWNDNKRTTKTRNPESCRLRGFSFFVRGMITVCRNGSWHCDR